MENISDRILCRNPRCKRKKEIIEWLKNGKPPHFKPSIWTMHKRNTNNEESFFCVVCHHCRYAKNDAYAAQVALTTEMIEYN